MQQIYTNSNYSLIPTIHDQYYTLKDWENNIMSRINYSSIRFWRFKDKFYYRHTPNTNLVVGNKKTIVQEISSRFNTNVHIVKDLNDVLLSTTKQIRVNTVFIEINSIPLVEEEVFNTKIMNEVYFDNQGLLFRNLFRGTAYLNYRFQDVNISYTTESFVKLFLNTFVASDNKESIINFIGEFFNNLESRSHMLMLVDNKEVSEKIFFQKIIIPIFGVAHCITILTFAPKSK